MSLMDKLTAMRKEHQQAIKDAEKSGTLNVEWTSREKQRNDIPVLVNHTQDLSVLHAGILDEKDGMGECISFLLQSKDNGAVFNVRWYLATAPREGEPSRENKITRNLLLQVYEQFGLFEDQVCELKGKTIRAKVEKVVGFGKDHYAISNLAQPMGDGSSDAISDLVG